MPEGSRNLISYGMLERSGCKYQGGDFKVHFYKKGRKVVSGKYKEGLYHLQGSVLKVSGTKEEGSKKRKSKKVTFSENLILGPTPSGFGTGSVFAQGGDSFSSKEDEESKGVGETGKEDEEEEGLKVEEGIV